MFPIFSILHLIYLIFIKSNVLGATLIIGEEGYFSDYEKQQMLWNYSFYIPDLLKIYLKNLHQFVTILLIIIFQLMQIRLLLKI